MYKLILICTICYCSSSALTQKIVRSSISTLGSKSKVSDILIQSTVGQGSPTTCLNSEEGLALRQGFQQPISIGDEKNDFKVVVYPNPSNGEFTITTDLTFNITYDYTVFDIYGCVLQFGTAEGNESKLISLKSAYTGIYYLRVKSGDLHSNLKISLIN